MNITQILDKFSHNFLENALVGMINDLSLWMGGLNIPVFVLNTGDETFIMDENKLTTLNRDRETLYQQTPRIVLDIQDVQFQRDELTSPHEKARFVLNMDEGSREFKARVQRVPMEVGVGLELITDNILYALKYTEILTMILSKQSVFEYTYLGKVYSGSYIFNYSIPDKRNITMGYDSDKRNRVLSTELVLQLAYPNFNLFRKAAGVVMPPPNGAFANGLEYNGEPNNNLVIDPDLEDVTDGGKMTAWDHEIKDKDGDFTFKTTYNNSNENPIPIYNQIKNPNT